MVMFNLMTKENIYSTTSLSPTVVLIYLQMTLKLIKDTKSNIFGNPVFDMKVVTESGLIITLFAIKTIKNIFLMISSTWS